MIEYVLVYLYDLIRRHPRVFCVIVCFFLGFLFSPFSLAAVWCECIEEYIFKYTLCVCGYGLMFVYRVCVCVLF